MAEKTIPLSVAQSKQNLPQSLISLEFLPDGTTPVVSSLHLAEHFEIRHHHVMRDIKGVLLKVPESFRKTNFGFTSRTVAGPNNSTREEPFYLLTRDGFTLLAMGYNSARAIAWKLKYIEAFNALEAAALRNARAAALRAGATQAYTLSTLQKRRLLQAVRWRKMGLGVKAIATLLGMYKREVEQLLKVAVALGKLPEEHKAAPKNFAVGGVIA